jgi:hypothetical protein
MSANLRQHGGDHYKNGKLEHWDLVERNGIGYLEAAATKYLSRFRKKAGLLDLQKALHYTDKLIELHKEGVRLPRGVTPMGQIWEFLNAQEVRDVQARAAITLLLRWCTIEHLEAARGDIAELIMLEEPVHANT